MLRKNSVTSICDQCLVNRVESGLGGSFEFLNRRLITFGLFTATAEAVKSSVYLIPGIRVGGLVRLNRFQKFSLVYDSGFYANVAERLRVSSLEFKVRRGISQSLEFGFLAKLARFDNSRKHDEIGVTASYFF